MSLCWSDPMRTTLLWILFVSPLDLIARPPIVAGAARVVASHLLIKCLFTRCFHLAQASLNARLLFSFHFFWWPLAMASNYKSADCAGIEIMP